MAPPRATPAGIVRRVNEVAGNALRTPQMQECSITLVPA